MSKTPGLDAAELSVAELVGALAREKTAAEEYATAFSLAPKRDMERYFRGVGLYANAKADFDGLVTQLVFDVKSGNDPSGSTKFATALRGAAEKRVAFTDFVKEALSAALNPEERGRLDLLGISKLVPEIVKSLTEAGLAIWKSFRQAKKERQVAILAELERLRWRSFADLTTSGGNHG
jgi:hypothetical protein